MQKLLDRILRECSVYTKQGTVAKYIPELAKADVNDFGICVISNDEISFSGDYNKNFTMQSIVKPIILLMALMDNGPQPVRDLVGVEATGKPFDAFNYSDQALNGEHINPMINTGAIALCTLIKGDSYSEKFSRLLDLTQKISGNPNLEVDEQVYQSEKATGNKNRALAYMLKAYNLIQDDVEDVLDFYFRACSIKTTSVDLAKIAFAFANGGNVAGVQLFPKEYAK